MSKEEQVCENSTALNSDTPNLEMNISYPHSFDENFGSFEDDEFGDFDSNDGFCSFDELYQPPLIFNSLQEALCIWNKLLNEIYNYKPHDSFTENAPKSISLYVLEEAPESLHSRLTWDSVTKYMDNDTGIPKVRWHQSEIEKFHLMALSCKRSASSPAPAMLEMTSNKPNPIDTNVSNVPLFQSSSTATEQDNTTLSLEKRSSSIFGLSSLSRFFPHLSKSNLPRSPTSPISPNRHSFQSAERASPLTPPSPLTPSDSKPRNVANTYHNDLYSLQEAYNDMNITSAPVATTPHTNVKRSNTVAFSSRFKDSSIITASSSPPSSTSFATARPRSTSYHKSTDLFDLDMDVQSPATPIRFKTNFRPLIPTIRSAPLSPAVVNSSPKIMQYFSTAMVGDTGHVTAKQDNDDVFGTKKAPEITTSEDSFGLDSIMMVSASQSPAKTPTPAKLMFPTILSPTIVSPQIMSLNTQKTNKQSIFDMPTVNDQSYSGATEEDDDWGDWAF